MDVYGEGAGGYGTPRSVTPRLIRHGTCGPLLLLVFSTGKDDVQIRGYTLEEPEDRYNVSLPGRKVLE